MLCSVMEGCKVAVSLQSKAHGWLHDAQLITCRLDLLVMTAAADEPEE